MEHEVLISKEEHFNLLYVNQFEFKKEYFNNDNKEKIEKVNFVDDNIQNKINKNENSKIQSFHKVNKNNQNNNDKIIHDKDQYEKYNISQQLNNIVDNFSNSIKNLFKNIIEDNNKICSQNNINSINSNIGNNIKDNYVLNKIVDFENFENKDKLEGKNKEVENNENSGINIELVRKDEENVIIINEFKEEFDKIKNIFIDKSLDNENKILQIAEIIRPNMFPY